MDDDPLAIDRDVSADDRVPLAVAAGQPRQSLPTADVVPLKRHVDHDHLWGMLHHREINRDSVDGRELSRQHFVVSRRADGGSNGLQPGMHRRLMFG